MNCFSSKQGISDITYKNTTKYYSKSSKYNILNSSNTIKTKCKKLNIITNKSNEMKKLSYNGNQLKLEDHQTLMRTFSYCRRKLDKG